MIVSITFNCFKNVETKSENFYFYYSYKIFAQFLRICLFISFQRFNVKLKRMYRIKMLKVMKSWWNDQLFVNSFERMSRQKA